MNSTDLRDAGIFVGRRLELTVLGMLLEAGASGRGGLALIAGEPGIGKSRLLAELATKAGECGARVLWGRCYEGEGAPAFWPWIQVLRSYAGSRGRAEAPEVRAAQSPELAILAPELGTAAAAVSLPSIAAAQERFRLFEAVTTFLKALAANEPVLVLLDDLHSADTSSLLLLDYLCSELAGSRLCVVGSYRDSEVRRGEPLYSVLGEIARRPYAARVALGGLDEQDIARFIEATTGVAAPVKLVQRIARETNGNPLYMTHMVRLLALEPGAAESAAHPLLPPTLRELIVHQLDRLTPACFDTLSVAAVVGREFELAVVALAGAGGRDQALDALEEAEAAQIIRQSAGMPGQYRFTHALIRQTLYDELPSIRRARLHLRVAEAIEALHGQNSGAQVAELAAHYRLAAPVGSAERAAAYARRAGDAAASVFAWEEAMAQWRVALELARADDWRTRCELLLALAEAQNNVGEREAAKDAFVQAAGAARRLRAAGDETGYISLLARAALGYGGPGVSLGALDERQVGLLTEALAAMGIPGPDAGAEEPERQALTARLLARLALALFWTPRREESLTLSSEAIAAARASGDPRALIAALDTHRYVLWGPDYLEQRAGFAGEMVELAASLGEAQLVLQGLRWRVVDCFERGEANELDAAIARYEQLGEELRLPYFRWYARMFRATRALTSGRWEEGERLAHEAAVYGERAGDPDAAAFLTVQLLPGRLLQGRAAEYVETVRQLVDRYPALPAYRSRLASICAELGELDEARAAFENVARRTADPAAGEFAAVPRDGNRLVTLVHLASACCLLGDRARAATLYDLMRPYAGRNVITGAAIACTGPSDYFLGCLAALLDRADQASAHFDAALALAARLDAAPQLALIRHAYARLLCRDRTAGAEARARALLEAALATAQTLEMPPLEQAIGRTLAEQTPLQAEPVRRGAAPAHPDGLSAREVEVLRLLAAGLSNREIAATLSLSVVTVQNHVASIYRKADVRNRAEAATYALRHGLSEPAHR